MRVLIAAVLLASLSLARAQCPPEGLTPAQIGQLRLQGFAIGDDATRNRLALALLDCVGDRDPGLRDDLAFAPISSWLRGKLLTADTVLQLREALLAQLRDPRDPYGFRRPFAVLLLSEVARADRIDPLFAPAQRAAMVDAAIAYIDEVNDYRGYSDTEGWRHGVAHAADLILQLAINPKVDAPAVERLMNALASRIAPNVKVYYIHGEPERLVRAVYFTWARGVLDAAFWTRWFDVIASPQPAANWAELTRTERGLARRHNTQAFLLNLAYAARKGSGASDPALLAEADRALARFYGE
jgi:hypothetical protein